MSNQEAGLDAAALGVSPHEIVVARTARYYTLGDEHQAPRELWIVCHGYAQLASRFVRQFIPIATDSRLIVAPEALSRFYLDAISTRRHQSEPRVGATWMTREHREAEIRDYIGYLDRVVVEVREMQAGDAPRLVVLGFSQGTATVCRWLASSRVRAERLVLWGGTVPPEIDLTAWHERLRGAAVTLVAGEEDEMVPIAAMIREADRLNTAGVTCELVRYPGRHTIDNGALQQLTEKLGTVLSAPR